MDNRTNRAKPYASRQLDLKDVSVTDRYWSAYVSLVRDTVIPYQWEALNDKVPDAEPSHAIRNFRIAAGLEEGQFAGFVFQDTDVYKWLEAVGYALAVKPDADLERTADEAIRLIASAQREDGYLNTYFTVAAPGKEWTNLMDCHEMYTAGHLIEAAVAYYRGTGKTELLKVAMRLADHIDERFGPEPGKIRGYDGHQEIELALVKLYEATGEAKYLKLASFLIDERGREPQFFHEEWEQRGRISHWAPNVVQSRLPDLAYHQAHRPVREQSEAAGHAVRAVYMYTAMADLALHGGDEELLAACRRLWSNIVNKQLYITGGIGSTHHGEAFTFDYDLPNDTNYSETCASIGLIFFARRMLQLEAKGEYGDVMERALYNTVTAGIAGDGKHYFYVNPMEVWPQASRGNPGKHHIKPVRQKWYGCACCPPNVARMLSSLGHYIFTAGDDTLYTHLYIGNETSAVLAGREVKLKLESGLPWKGSARLAVVEANGTGPFTLALRVPAWSKRSTFTLNGEPAVPELKDGYAYFTRDWQPGDELAVELDMTPQRVYAHPELRANAGRVALQRGPLVYCFEEADNGAPLASLALPRHSELRVVDSDWRGGVVLLQAEGVRVASAKARQAVQPVAVQAASVRAKPLEPHGNARPETPLERQPEEQVQRQAEEQVQMQQETEPEALYRTEPPRIEPCRLTAAPYTLWGNRQPGEMLVWIREQ